MEYSVHSAYFKFYLKWKCEKMKNIQQNIQIDTENLYRWKKLKQEILKNMIGK